MNFQHFNLILNKTVYENVLQALKLANYPKSQRKQRVNQCLQFVGLDRYANTYPAKLSGGQKQRVAIARALANEPSLLMLDEPLSALDALTRIEMQNLIETIWQKNNFTALLVTHDVGEAVRLADRIILIEDGNIAFDEKVNAPRPRKLTNPELIELEEKILNRLMHGEEASVQLQDANNVKSLKVAVTN